MFTREELKEIQFAIAKEREEMKRFIELNKLDKEWCAKWDRLKTIYDRILDTL